jgi:hypothetical protein
VINKRRIIQKRPNPPLGGDGKPQFFVMLRQPGCLSRQPGFIFKGYKPKTADYGYEYPAVRRSSHEEARRSIRISPKVQNQES